MVQLAERRIRYEAELDHSFAKEMTGRIGDESLRHCIQCGTCSSTCPVSLYMDYTPRRIVAMTREGFKDDVLGGCHYINGNYKALRRYKLLKRVLEQMGIEDKRVRLEWIAASEGEKVQRVINEMTEEIKELGPMKLPPTARSSSASSACKFSMTSC